MEKSMRERALELAIAAGANEGSLIEVARQVLAFLQEQDQGFLPSTAAKHSA